MARNHVWQVNVTDMEFQYLKDKYPIISTIPSEKGWEVQLVADELKDYEAENYEPNLEHGYVYFMDYLLKDKMEMHSNDII